MGCDMILGRLWGSLVDFGLHVVKLRNHYSSSPFLERDSHEVSGGEGGSPFCGWNSASWESFQANDSRVAEMIPGWLSTSFLLTREVLADIEQNMVDVDGDYTINGHARDAQSATSKSVWARG